MSLNTSHANGGVLIYNSERILIYYDGVEMAIDMPGGSPHFKGNKKGRIYLTTHRVIFNNKDIKDMLQSFSMPFFTMRELELEQPIFGANYIKGQVKAEPGGNWEGEGKFRMWFNHGGAIEFGQAMLHAGQMASRYFTHQAPVYTPPTASYYQAPPPAYAPPTGPAYAFVPHDTFPMAPPLNSVYVYEAPPPYPGIDPNLPPYPMPHTNGQAAGGAYAAAFPDAPPGSAAAAKAAEAAASAGGGGGSAYYDPANPHNVYMPASAPPLYAEAEQQAAGAFAPPPYNEAAKKSV
jgi:hypothetical protein